MAVRIEKPSPQTSEAGEKTSENGEKNVLLKKSIVNKLNFLNFFDKGLQCQLDQLGEKGDMTVNLKPLPSFGKYLVCLWPEELVFEADTSEYRMKNISIPDTASDINIVPEIKCLTSKGFCIRLPDQCEIKSHSVGDNSMFSDMKVRINQNNVSVACEIAELKDNTLSVALAADALYYFSHFDSSLKVNVAFVKEGEILFTGQYMIKKWEDLLGKRLLTLEPESQMINRFPPKKFRSNRENLKPSPDVIFTHPFTGRQITMLVRDLSGSGFSVNSGTDESLLLTGMVIRNMQLSFAGVFTLSCSAQVVHRSEERRENTSADDGPSDENKTLVYGFALIDMPLTDHLKLQSIMHQCENNHSKVCNSLNPDELWRFFFETGFIYSKKYRSFIENKDLIRDTYIKLYSQSLDISRHFTYLEKGEILGHLSMLRFYENAWLIHHHAALKKANVKAGLAVLNQVAKFSYNSIWLEACHMRYMFCYFRPENAFPDYFFNGFAEKLNDKNGCSTDPFAYYTFKKPSTSSKSQSLPQGWKIGNCTNLDLEDLRTYYMKNSGGLMIDALDLSPDSTPSAELEDAYHKAGLSKEKHLLSLRYQGDLAAVILVNIADIAINMSDLTSSVTLMVLKEDILTREILNMALVKLTVYFTQKRFPVLLYPLSYAKKQAIPFQKTYILWILATRYSDHYFEYLDQINMLGSGKH